MEIRHARADDFDALIELDPIAKMSEVRRTSIGRWIAEGMCYVVDNGSIIAYAVLDPYYYEQNAFIAMLMVAREYRRKGIGCALLEHFEFISKSEKMFTSTNQSNLPMQQLLESCSYTRSGIIENLDEDDPEIVYVKKRA